MVTERQVIDEIISEEEGNRERILTEGYRRVLEVLLDNHDTWCTSASLANSVGMTGGAWAESLLRGLAIGGAIKHRLIEGKHAKHEYCASLRQAIVIETFLRDNQ